MDYPTPDTVYAPTKLQLPLFLTSRNRIRLNRLREVRRYITKKAKSFAPCVKGCDEFDDMEEDLFVMVVDVPKKVKMIVPPKKRKPKDPKDRPWQLAPNRYTLPKEITGGRKGMLGAYWSRTKRAPMGPKVYRTKHATAWYDIPRDSEKHFNKCNFHKGGFLTDPRRRRPSSRFMVSNVFTCMRNPKDPGPANYFRGIFERQLFPKIKEKPPLPYRFLRYSVVPEKKNAAIGQKSSFFPGPGRYELADDEDALVLTLEIDKQKRLRFRHQKYRRIKTDNLKHKPIWRHIYGFGFPSIFKSRLLYAPVATTKVKGRKMEHAAIVLYPSIEYIRMINNPERKIISRRDEPVKRKPSEIRYNCMVKVIIRRQLRTNKKIAFNSGVPRFVDSDIMPSAKKAIKVKPLPEYPVMSVDPSELKSRLHELPVRLRGTFKENRIRPFKFQPLPPPKLLLDGNELQQDKLAKAELFEEEVDPLKFYKAEYKSRLGIT